MNVLDLSRAPMRHGKPTWRPASAPIGRWGAVAALALLLAAPAESRADLTFNFIARDGISQQALDGFREAGAMWSSLFVDNITVNINVGFESWGTEEGWLAEAWSDDVIQYSYAATRAALIADATSADDRSSSASLQSGESTAMLINLTADNPHGSASATPYLDDDGGANNSIIQAWRANAKALGLLAGDDPGTDGYITFNSDFLYDFDRSDGIDADAFDFVAIAAHEIGHVLGFYSGSVWLEGAFFWPPYDEGAPYDEDVFTIVNTLDLFRFSAESLAYGPGVFDWTIDEREKFFSVDGGLTSTGATFSTGSYFGDGGQPGHWKDGMGLGIMDPTFAPGELGRISPNDVRALDVIGYDLRSAVVPEPSSLAMTVLGLVGMACWARRTRAAA